MWTAVFEDSHVARRVSKQSVWSAEEVKFSHVPDFEFMGEGDGIPKLWKWNV